MGYETEKADAKRVELETVLSRSFYEVGVEDPERLVGEVILAFTHITAPYYELPPVRMITMSAGGYEGGSSVKPGNVVLNLHKLVMAVASGTLTAAGSATTPWLLLPGALVIWDALYSSLRLDIGEVHACVIWALWISRDGDSTVGKADVLDTVNRERRIHGRTELSRQEVDDALRDLVKMRCIEQSRQDNGRWWLREWVRIAYRD
jgi:hypothetical protein